jgi:hypothetical protein
MYRVTLDTTDTGTLGTLRMAFNEAATCLPVWQDFMVLPANIYDSLVSGSDLIDVSMAQILGTAVSSPATAGILDVNVKNIDNDAASASGTVTFPNATLASTTNITAGTITTVTNLTNAPTAGDLTATMKTSVTTAATAATPTAAAVTGAVGSVTGNVGGNVTGSVGSVVGAVGSVTGLTASNLDATISSRLASASYTAPPSAAANASQVRTELTTELARIDVATSTRLASASYTAPLDAAGTRTAVGLATANLDTQLAAELAQAKACANAEVPQVVWHVGTVAYAFKLFIAPVEFGFELGGCG